MWREPKRALPRNEEGLSQVVVDINNQVVIGHSVNVRPRELPIDQNALQTFSNPIQIPPWWASSRRRIQCDLLNYLSSSWLSWASSYKKRKLWKNSMTWAARKSNKGAFHLLLDPKWVNVAISDFPGEEPVRVVPIGSLKEGEEEEPTEDERLKKKKTAAPHLPPLEESLGFFNVSAASKDWSFGVNGVEREAQWDQICIAVYITADFGGNNVKKFNLGHSSFPLSLFL